MELISREKAIKMVNKWFNLIELNIGEWIRTGRTNVYGGEELMCPFCGDRVMAILCLGAISRPLQ